MNELLTVEEVSKILKVTKDQVYRWIKAGALDAIKLHSGTIRLTEDHINDFLHMNGKEDVTE